MITFWDQLKALPLQDKLLLPWRFIWVCVAYVCRFGLSLSIGMAWGWKEAKRAWRDTV